MPFREYTGSHSRQSILHASIQFRHWSIHQTRSSAAIVVTVLICQWVNPDCHSACGNDCWLNINLWRTCSLWCPRACLVEGSNAHRQNMIVMCVSSFLHTLNITSKTVYARQICLFSRLFEIPAQINCNNHTNDINVFVHNTNKAKNILKHTVGQHESPTCEYMLCIKM